MLIEKATASEGRRYIKAILPYAVTGPSPESGTIFGGAVLALLRLFVNHEA
jgi:hypothetical protein